jgi:hypothetical protein
MLVKIDLNANEIKTTYPGNDNLRIAIQQGNEFYFHEFNGFSHAISDSRIMDLTDRVIDEAFFKVKIKEKAKCQ